LESKKMAWWHFFLGGLGLYLLYAITRRLRRRSLKDQIVLITGGGSGIGRRMALKFSKLGCKIVIWDINEQGATKVANEVKEQGGQAWAYICNVASNKDVKALAERVNAEVGKVDILVNNAGIVSGKFILDLSEEHIIRTMMVNTISHFWTIQAFLPAMIKENKGHIVTIASAAGMCGVNGLMDYCSSKFGAFGTNESLRLDLRKKRITGVYTTVVCPYYINTGMFDGVKTKASFLLPIMEEDYASERMVDAVRHGDKLLTLPWVVRLIWLGRFLFPVGFNDWLADVLGISSTMDEFKGRGWEASDPNAVMKKGN